MKNRQHFNKPPAAATTTTTSAAEHNTHTPTKARKLAIKQIKERFFLHTLLDHDYGDYDDGNVQKRLGQFREHQAANQE